MKSTFDTDDILYSILYNSPLKNAISGGIYKEGDRPAGSRDEDVIINSIILTQDSHPQLGVSNINVYVPDRYIETKGSRQMVQNRDRMKALTAITVSALRSANVYGLAITIEDQTPLRESDIKQHYVNIRISWNIQG